MKPATLHFIVLSLILMGGVVSFVMLTGDVVAQQRIGIATSIAYVVWGILHNGIHGDLHPKVVIEYMLVGAVAVLVLINVLRP